MSNIRVIVRWETSPVFAGEDVKCIITFKNIIKVPEGPRSASPTSQDCTNGPSRHRWKFDLPISDGIQFSKPYVLTTATSSATKRTEHRSTLSLGGDIVGTHGISGYTSTGTSIAPANTDHQHRRSVSIMSIGTQPGSANETDSSRGWASSNLQPARRHNRSASVHGVSLRGTTMHTRPIGSSFGHSRPSRVISNSRSQSVRSLKEGFPSQTTTDQDNISMLKDIPSNSARRTVDSNPDKLIQPLEKGLPSLEIHQSRNEREVRDSNRRSPNMPLPQSNKGTPKNSFEIYSTQNDSSETLASEYVAPGIVHQQPNGSSQVHQSPHLSPILSQNQPIEILIMGYVQLMGSFTLDASLVNLTPFENIKKKGVIGGQGSGGVVGIEPSTKDRGLLSGLGWNSIGSSLGSLLGGHELSSFKGMRENASTRSIPVLTTPQSILFVDLKLGPGESKSYLYQNKLPKGIPPTHKGRAMKVSYQLVIGLQRAQFASQQQMVQQVDVPFTVLPGINGYGEVLGHDLMHPHIMLQSTARSKSIDSTSTLSKFAQFNHGPGQVHSSSSGFLSYANSLLDKSRRSSRFGILSPTELNTPGTQNLQAFDEMPIKALIDIAIASSNSVSSSRRNPVRFQIQRGGQQVATIKLARPTYRLGETVFAVIDFCKSEIACYSLRITLETSETVDPVYALRSSNSIGRVTRRVHASWFERTLCTERTIFSSMIPISATPEFITSGVSLSWKIRFEFVTSLPSDVTRLRMNENKSDGRGRIFSAVRDIPCESFEVQVPIRVYGATGETHAQQELSQYTI